MNAHATTSVAALKRGLIAILRGIRPGETKAIVDGLVATGIEAIEVPLNSPQPFHAIEIARRSAPDNCLIGAGTVLDADDVGRVHTAGGEFVVTPNTDPTVIARAKEMAMDTMAGVFSPTEALYALKSGADALKFFPAGVLGPAGITAISAVLPTGTLVAAVGNVGHEDFPAYMRAGIRTFGLGSALYKPGLDAAAVSRQARTIVDAYDTAARMIAAPTHRSNADD